MDPHNAAVIFGDVATITGEDVSWRRRSKLDLRRELWYGLCDTRGYPGLLLGGRVGEFR